MQSRIARPPPSSWFIEGRKWSGYTRLVNMHM